jgi:thiol-disulfide isomerase/thioredoxin
MKKFFVNLSMVIMMLFSITTVLNAKLHTTPPSDEKLQEYFTTLAISVPTQQVKAPNFTLPSLKGKDVSLSDYRGKVVFLNFWATWCPPCRFEMPSMEELHQSLKSEGLEVVAVDLGETKKKVADYIDSMNLTFTTLLDTRQQVGAIYGIRSIPTTFIVDQEGWLLGMAIGAREWSSKESIEMFRLLLQTE